MSEQPTKSRPPPLFHTTPPPAPSGPRASIIGSPSFEESMSTILARAPPSPSLNQQRHLSYIGEPPTPTTTISPPSPPQRASITITSPMDDITSPQTTFSLLGGAQTSPAFASLSLASPSLYQSLESASEEIDHPVGADQLVPASLGLSMPSFGDPTTMFAPASSVIRRSTSTKRSTVLKPHIPFDPQATVTALGYTSDPSEISLAESLENLDDLGTTTSHTTSTVHTSHATASPPTSPTADPLTLTSTVATTVSTPANPYNPASSSDTTKPSDSMRTTTETVRPPRPSSRPISVSALPNAQRHSTTVRGGKRQRNYQVFPGRNVFFCGGRLMTSREHWAFLIAFSLVLIPGGLFAGFTCPWLWTNIHPALPIIFAYMFVLAIASMLRTSLTDPGIIPRNLDPSPPLDDFDELVSSNRNSFAYGSMFSRNMPLPKDVKVKDTNIRLKYCETCKIYRPPRASHCRQCDNCVENEDHHCIWLNNCIGRRNYRPFFTFIFTATVMCLYVLSLSLAHVVILYMQGRSKTPGYGFGTAIGQAPVSFVLVFITFVLVWSVGGLTGYHLFLISRNVTTHEQLRASMVRRQHFPNPFDFNNPFLNCLYVLCRPQTKSYLRRRKYVEEELEAVTTGTAMELNENVEGERRTEQQDAQAGQRLEVLRRTPPLVMGEQAV
ncbi:DHHC palmitoyltransferase-domain-containing protein [Jimgerdemannia flammicorona]|uniref:DHHC palmitoyltransferase-domain-containing protein n=2 Tax=Jimgerdemannia flammicorona TaxID=994334 RepID=A0A433DGC0_9FUNG|nr:DHHC palmitoyltransferase-domain-containing protein [Jimgerdemannia flammicorona]RUS32247.1 DHHC palmitoyltransferase-domain-containing protein [Jimgerdemannia flammicorona]